MDGYGRHFQVWLRHVRPRSQSYTFGVKGQKKFVSVLCCFWLHQLTLTHTPLIRLAQGPFTSFVQSFDTWYSDKRLADRFTGFRVNTSHQGQSILQSSILAYWTLSGIDPGTKSTTSTTTGYQFPSGIGTPAVGLTPPPPPPRVQIGGSFSK